jgi:hypothetical protein
MPKRKVTSTKSVASKRSKPDKATPQKVVVPAKLKPDIAIRRYIEWMNVSHNRDYLLSATQKFTHLGTAALKYSPAEDKIAASIVRKAKHAKKPVSFTVSVTEKYPKDHVMHYNAYIVEPYATGTLLHKFDPGVGKWDGMTAEIDKWVAKSFKGDNVFFKDHSVPVQKCTKDHMCQTWTVSWLLENDLKGLNATDKMFASFATAKSAQPAKKHLQDWMEWWTSNEPYVVSGVVEHIATKDKVAPEVAHASFSQQIERQKFQQAKVFKLYSQM